MALAAGDGGTDAVRHLIAAEYSKHVLFVRGIVDETRRLGHPDAAYVRRAYDLLATAQEHDLPAAESVLRYPSVGVWARKVLWALRDSRRSAKEPLGLAAVAAAAAVKAGLAFSMEITPADGTITLPSLGQILLPGRPGAVTVRSAGDGEVRVLAGGAEIHVPAKDGEVWRGLRPLSASADDRTISLLVDDLDPYRMPAAPVAGRLTEAEHEAWQRALTDAWLLLVRHHETTATEILAILRVLTPLRRPATGVSSATSRDAFGCAAMSTPPDGLAMAATLAHEVQHAKLSGLLDMIALTRIDDGRRYYAPWRDDPRPISGLLQGTYAYLGVTAFWRRQRLHGEGAGAVHAHTRFARWRAAALSTADVLLRSGALTARGEEFVTEMRRTLRAWADEPVPPQALADADREAEEHRRAWRERNPHVPG
ncbi:HEXXH motif domain-containing protein [Nonomuraea rubra]|uniref:HEXXH motif domain-containing protein n=1 Tax=Nonomuraea rubra TaxID=46180 RepID=UPI0033E078C8